MFGIGFGEIVVIALIALFWAVVIVLAISMLRWVVGGGVRDATKTEETTSGRRTARQILDERYASGDLARDEYERMRQDIEAG